MSFTESCLAVAVVSTTMAIAAPSLSRARESFLLQSAARHVAATMHAARVSAITRNRDCRMMVTAPISYAIECQNASWMTIENVTLPQSMTVTANARPKFHTRGNVSPTATFRVCDRLRCLQVIVNVNGRVRIQ